MNHDLDLIKAEDRELRARQNLEPTEPQDDDDNDYELLAGAIVASAAIVMAGAVMIAKMRKPAPPAPKT